MRKRKTGVRVEGAMGDCCPRRSHITAVFEHAAVTDKQLAKPFYYSRWFRCEQPECVTTLIMPERFKVYRR